MYGVPRAAGVALYIVWILATVALVAGRYTPLPLWEPVHHLVVAGGVVLTILGAGMLLRRGVRRLDG